MKSKLKKNVNIIFTLAITTLLLTTVFSLKSVQPITHPEPEYFNIQPRVSNYDEFSKGNFTDYEFSSYNLSVYLDDNTSTVAGNLTVDYYNNDPKNFTRIPFHIYASGMQYDIRPGNIEILNVTNLEDPKIELDFDFFNSNQLMWVNLTDKLEPNSRTSFIISFNTTLPDGGIDRASDYGWDHNQSRIFKFANCYPQPCVYDEYDGWNTDPYILTGDPFYFDMSYYDFIVNVPKNMKVAATGELIESNIIGERRINHYNPTLPVREVTFSASEYFIVESLPPGEAPPGINVSIFYLPKSYDLWHGYAFEAYACGDLYNDTLGIYPYSTYNIVEEYTAHGGMEYPLQVYVSEAADRAGDPFVYLLSVIVHETAHQWFYNLVGVDEVDWGFLDESIVCWLSEWSKDVFYPHWNMFEPLWIMDYVWYYSLNYGLPNKINQSIPECFSSGTDYVYTAYRKAPVVLENLRRLIGHDKFIEGLELFTHDFYFEIATFQDFIQSFETVIGGSLDWFFFPWFDNPYLPKYSFKDVIYDAQTKLINFTIEDVNELLNPYNYSQIIPLRIFSSMGLEFSEDIWINSTTKFSIPIQNKPLKIMLDYSKNIPVQLTVIGEQYLQTTNIKVINETPIPGYNMLILVISMLGIIVLIGKKSQLFHK